MRNAGLEETQAGIKIARININNLRYADNQLMLYWLHQSLWLCRSQQSVENSERDGNTRPASWKICMQVKKQQLEPDMEQPTGSKLGK